MLLHTVPRTPRLHWVKPKERVMDHEVLLNRPGINTLARMSHKAKFREPMNEAFVIAK